MNQPFNLFQTSACFTAKTSVSSVESRKNIWKALPWSVFSLSFLFRPGGGKKWILDMKKCKPRYQALPRSSNIHMSGSVWRDSINMIVRVWSNLQWSSLIYDRPQVQSAGHDCVSVSSMCQERRPPLIFCFFCWSRPEARLLISAVLADSVSREQRTADKMFVEAESPEQTKVRKSPAAPLGLTHAFPLVPRCN